MLKDEDVKTLFTLFKCRKQTTGNKHADTHILCPSGSYQSLNILRWVIIKETTIFFPFTKTC